MKVGGVGKVGIGGEGGCGNVYADENRLGVVDILEVLGEPVELLLVYGAGVVVAAGGSGVDHVVEHNEVPVADIAGIVCGAEGVAEFLVGFWYRLLFSRCGRGCR